MRMSPAASLKSLARLLAPQGRLQMRIHTAPMHILSDVRNVMQGIVGSHNLQHYMLP